MARFLPRTAVKPRYLWLIRLLTALTTILPRRGVPVIPVAPGVSVRWFAPPRGGRSAALLWIHGGGFVIGNAAQDDGFCRKVARELGIAVASVEYRLAPEHPFPRPLEDCYAALRWLAWHPDVDPDRIAVGGASAGAGLAAALALLAKERGEVRPVLQLLSYPMLDDRTTLRSDVDETRLRMWNAESNRFGWQSYLGPHHRPGADGVPALAAPARYGDLSGLPPAWLGVGTNDLFYDEDIAYAERLRRADVACALHVVPGAYHGFDLVETGAGVSRTFLQARIAALEGALHGNAIP